MAAPTTFDLSILGAPPAQLTTAELLEEAVQKFGDRIYDDIRESQGLSSAITLFVNDPGASNPNTYTASRPSQVSSIPERDGTIFVFSTFYENTGPVTLNGKPINDMRNRPLEPGVFQPSGRYLIRYSSFLDGYVLVTEGVGKAEMNAVGSALTLGVSPAIYEASSVGNRQWVAGRTYVRASMVYALEVYAAVPGEIEVAVFSGSANLVKGDRLTVPVPKAGQQTILLDRELVVNPGERVGWWATPGLVRATSGVSDGFGGYYSNGSANLGKQESFSVPGASTGVRFSVNFRLRFGGSGGALDAALSALRVGLKGRVESWPETRSYILVWGVGQSNGAGRGRTPSAHQIEVGRGFKYDPANGVVHLVEPTGTDSLAQASRYVSFGSAMAAGVLAATAGRVGVIFVNSCVGATTIEDWGDGGTVWSNAKAQIAAALSSILSQRLNVVGAIAVFCQGEGDSYNTPAATYKAGVSGLLDRMRSEIGLPRLKMLIAQTGTNGNTGDTAGFQLVRKAQSELANDSDGRLIMAHTGARYFPERGLMFDDLHYTTQGYDEIGSALGAAVAAYGIGLRAPALDA